MMVNYQLIWILVTVCSVQGVIFPARETSAGGACPSEEQRG